MKLACMETMGLGVTGLIYDMYSLLAYRWTERSKSWYFNTIFDSTLYRRVMFIICWCAAILPESSPICSKYIYVHKLLIKHSLLIRNFHYTARLNWFLCFLCSVFFNNCISVFVVLLCFVFCALSVILSLLLWAASTMYYSFDSPPLFYIYIHMYDIFKRLTLR